MITKITIRHVVDDECGVTETFVDVHTNHGDAVDLVDLLDIMADATKDMIKSSRQAEST